jgi:hypothetical protein
MDDPNKTGFHRVVPDEKLSFRAKAAIWLMIALIVAVLYVAGRFYAGFFS